MGEIQWRGRPVVLPFLRALGDQEMGIVDDEAGSGSDPLGGGDGAVVVVDAEAGEEVEELGSEFDAASDRGGSGGGRPAGCLEGGDS